MPDGYVECPVRGKVKRFNVIFEGDDQTFTIEPGKIEAQVVAAMDPMLRDLLEIACAVFAADSEFTRGGLTRKNMGEGWTRTMSFNLPVRRPEAWSKPEVCGALVEAVEFLTGDRVGFTFFQKDEEIRPIDFLPFAPEGNPFEATEVILFSGGLDSFAGALEALATRNGNVVLVTHRSAQKAIWRQEELANYLKKDFPGRVLHIQIQAIRKGHEARETTQRSRSLLFAALGYTVAQMLGASRVSFYENGVVSQNLPISAQVIGTMATRTTHPLVLHLIEKLLHLITDQQIPIRNSFEWLTKKEVVEKIFAHGAANRITTAVSCTKVRDEEKMKTHCGACSQCLDRRFAMIAAGHERHDDSMYYRTEVLTGERETDRSRTIAMDWSRHGWRLADLSLEDFYQTYISDLTRVIDGHPDLSPSEVVRKTHAMQLRHSEVVRSVFKINAGAALDGGLPDTSLLKMFCAERLQAGDPVAVSARVSQSPADEPLLAADDAGFDPDRLEVAFYHVHGKKFVEVAHLGAVGGVPASVPFGLKSTFEADRDAGLDPNDYHYVPSGQVKYDGKPGKQNVHKSVERCRKTFAEFYGAISDEPLPVQFLIQHEGWQGYRLDPMMRIIGRHQVSKAHKSASCDLPNSGMSVISSSCQRSGESTP